MAQQAALRVWTDRPALETRRDPRPLPPAQARGRRSAPAARLRVRVPDRPAGRPPTAEDLRALGPGLGAALLELPLRDAGCLLPTWEELGALSAAARELGVPLHVDGARLWESQPFYDRPLAEIAGLVDSVYVSFYKGLGALAGAALAGPEDVVEEARAGASGWAARSST